MARGVRFNVKRRAPVVGIGGKKVTFESGASIDSKPRAPSKREEQGFQDSLVSYLRTQFKDRCVVVRVRNEVSFRPGMTQNQRIAYLTKLKKGGTEFGAWDLFVFLQHPILLLIESKADTDLSESQVAFRTKMQALGWTSFYVLRTLDEAQDMMRQEGFLRR